MNGAPGGWQTLEWPVRPEVLGEILDGGQSFRWSLTADGIWRGQWGRHAVELQAAGAELLFWRPLTADTTRDALAHYLALDQDFAAFADQLPWRSDPVLAQALAAFPGLRILRQDLGEALMAFICSSTKRIVQIKAIVELLAERFGSEIAPGLHAMPTWRQLAEVPEAELRACKLGYRARYLAETAQALARDSDWAGTLAALPYSEAHARLVELPGVGAKVADCVLLFGGQHLEAFPVDTWIVQAMSRWYGLDGWTPRQIAHFGRVHFGRHAGLAQQFFFAAARRSIALGPERP